MSKIKIVRIQSRIVIGGPAIHTRILSEKLNPEKYQTILIGGAGSDDEKSLVDDLKSHGIDCRVIPEMGRHVHIYDDLISFIKLYRILKKEKPDIIHTHTAKAGAVGRFAAFLARTPIIVHTFHGNVFSGYFGKIKSAIFKYLEILLAKLSNCIIVISTQQFNDICNKYRIAPSNKMKTIPLGFEWEAFDSTIHNNSILNRLIFLRINLSSQ